MKVLSNEAEQASGWTAAFYSETSSPEDRPRNSMEEVEGVDRRLPCETEHHSHETLVAGKGNGAQEWTVEKAVVAGRLREDQT